MKKINPKDITGMLIQFNAMVYRDILYDMYQWLRSKSKYEGIHSEAYDELIRLLENRYETKIHLNEENIDIYE